jgi:hypothetical protein
VAALNGMASAESATNNIIRPMRTVGLFNEDGTLTARGNRWRIDASYATACDEIMKDIYPQELTAFTDGDGAPDQARVTEWFEHEGFGKSNARQMGATYALIASKKIPAAPELSGKKSNTRATENRKTTKTAADTPSPAPAPSPVPERPSGSPNIHLDIQVHIPAGATLEQIDQIFASMAKHLYQ